MGALFVFYRFAKKTKALTRRDNMQNYVLKSDETVLYRGSVELLKDGKKDPKVKKTTWELLLTNYNIVVTSTTKKMWSEIVENIEHSVSDIKVYKGSKQIIRKGINVEIYLTSGELFLEFPNSKEAKDFTLKALRLASGNSQFVRGVKKVQSEIKETNEALDIDVVDIAKKAAVVTGNVVVEVAKASPVGSATSKFGIVAKVLLGGKKKETSPQIEAPKESDESEKEVQTI